MDLAISPGEWEDEALGRMWEASVLLAIVLLEWAGGIKVDAASEAGRGMRTMVLSETRHVAGLVLIPVLREGLKFGECLGETEGRANGPLRLPPAPTSQIPEPVGEGNEFPSRRLGGSVAMSALARSVLWDRRVLLFSRCGA
jgi:hypothetical protein